MACRRGRNVTWGQIPRLKTAATIPNGVLFLEKVSTCEGWGLPGWALLSHGENARKSVPVHSGGVSQFFDFVEKLRNPTPIGLRGNVRSLALPAGWGPLNRCHLRWALLAHGTGECTQERARLFWLEARCRGLPTANPYGRLVPLVSGFAKISPHVRERSPPEPLPHEQKNICHIHATPPRGNIAIYGVHVIGVCRRHSPTRKHFKSPVRFSA